MQRHELHSDPLKGKGFESQAAGSRRQPAKDLEAFSIHAG